MPQLQYTPARVRKSKRIISCKSQGRYNTHPPGYGNKIRKSLQELYSVTINTRQGTEMTVNTQLASQLNVTIHTRQGTEIQERLFGHQFIRLQYTPARVRKTEVSKANMNQSGYNTHPPGYGNTGIANSLLAQCCYNTHPPGYGNLAIFPVSQNESELQYTPARVQSH